MYKLIFFLSILFVYSPCFCQNKFYINRDSIDSIINKSGVERYSKKIKQEPFNWQFYRIRSECYLNLGDIKNAIKDVDKALKYCKTANSKWSLYLLKGNCHYRLTQYDLAISNFDIAIKYTSEQIP